MSTVATYKAGQTPVGYEQITVSSIAKKLTVPSKATRAVFGVESNPLRHRSDGTLPTTTVGMLRKADTFFEIEGHLALRAIRFIRSSGSDAVLNVSYYGEALTATLAPVSSPSSSVSSSPSSSPSASPS